MSYSNDERRIYELLAIAEQQQLEIDALIAALQHNTNTLKAELPRAIRTAALDTAKVTAEKAAIKIEQQVTEVVQEFDKVKWTHYAFAAGLFCLVFFILLTFFIWWIPSLDEIRERKAELQRVNFSTCDGQTCVRVKINTCGYGSTEKATYCIIDQNSK